MGGKTGQAKQQAWKKNRPHSKKLKEKKKFFGKGPFAQGGGEMDLGKKTAFGLLKKGKKPEGSDFGRPP